MRARSSFKASSARRAVCCLKRCASCCCYHDRDRGEVTRGGGDKDGASKKANDSTFSPPEERKRVIGNPSWGGGSKRGVTPLPTRVSSYRQRIYSKRNRPGNGWSAQVANSLVFRLSAGLSFGFLRFVFTPVRLPTSTRLDSTHVVSAFDFFHVCLVLVHDALDLRLQALRKQERAYGIQPRRMAIFLHADGFDLAA